MISITSVSFGERAEELVLATLRSGQIAQGRMVRQFEEDFARLCGVEHAVAVCNGTVSLMLALEAIGIRPGDEVVIPPFTFVATLNAALKVGATVRFADIDRISYNLDPSALAEVVNHNTRVVIPVHLFGYPADVKGIIDISPDIAIVEDAAQAHGARRGSEAAGSWGVGSFSFYATKNITTGEGGMVTTNDQEIATRVRLLANQGMRERYMYESPGYNFRMTDIQAALAIPQLEVYSELVSARQRNASILNEELGDLEGVVLPSAPSGIFHVWHQYTIRVTAERGISRDEVVTELNAQGVGAGVYYPRLVWDYECFRNHPLVRIDPTPVAAQVSREVLSLPVHQHLTDSQLEQIVLATRRALRA